MSDDRPSGYQPRGERAPGPPPRGGSSARRPRGLIDQFGEPISPAAIAALREEISPTNAALGRAPFAGHLAFGMDPQRLGAVLRAADSGSSQEWMILAEEIEELFPHYYAVLSKRKRQVVQLPITVTAAETSSEAERHADFVREFLETKALQRALFDVVDAIGKGFSVHEIIWDTAAGRVRPAEFSYRPQRFFELSWQDGETLWLRSERGFLDLAPHKFLLHRHLSKSGLVVRGGLTRAVAFVWMYASYTARDWALFCQGYGLPMRLGRYGPEASETDKRVLWRAVSSIAGDVAAIVPKSMEVEFVAAKGSDTGSDLYLKRADWLNHEVSKLVLGSTASTDAIRGSHAVGREHREAEQDVERFDAALLEDTITRQVIMPMIAFTFGPQDQYPSITVGQPEQVPLKDVIAGVTDLGPQGLRVRALDIYERLQLTPPEDGDETIGGVTPQAPPSPDIIHPPVTPPGAQTEMSSLLRGLIARHAEADPALMEALTERLAKDAAGAVAGLTSDVRHAFEAASDLHDLARRVHALKLDPAAFAEAMARGMALAQLVGQAALLDELHREAGIGGRAAS